MPREDHITEYEPITRSSQAAGSEWEPQERDAIFAEWEEAKPSNKMNATAAATPAIVEVFSSTKNTAENVAPSALVTKRKSNWILKRGHAISYAGLYLFTVVLFFRPYEYIPGLAEFTQLAFICALFTLIAYVPSQLALEGTLTARPREVNLVLLLCVTALVSMPLAISPARAWETFNDIFIKAVVMFIVMINVVRTERRLRGLLLLALLVSCALSVNAIRDYMRGNTIVEGYRILGSIGGMFANPNDLALHLSTMVPIAVAMFLGQRGVLKRLLYGMCLVLFVAAITVTYSRSGFLGLIFGAGVLALKIGRRNRLAVVVAMIFALLLFILFAPGNYGVRLISMVDFSRDVTGSASARKEVLMRSITVALNNPVFGVGMGNFRTMSIRELVSHNAYTEVAAEMGLLALVLYTMFIITPLRRLRKIEHEIYEAHEKSLAYYLAIGLQASLVAYMVSSFFASVAYLWYVYYLVGYSVCLRRIYESQTGRTVQGPNMKRKRMTKDRLMEHREQSSNDAFPEPATAFK